MLKKEKENVVAELKRKLEAAQSIVLTDFTGLNVKSINELRRKFEASSIEYLVAKNTLVRHAVADTNLQDLVDYLKGPTGLVLSSDDGVSATRILVDFAKENEKPRLKVGMLAGHIVSGDQVKMLASIPSRDVLLARLAGSLKAPICNLVFVLSGTLGRVVRVLDQVRQAKQAKENN